MSIISFQIAGENQICQLDRFEKTIIIEVNLLVVDTDKFHAASNIQCNLNDISIGLIAKKLQIKQNISYFDKHIILNGAHREIRRAYSCDCNIIKICLRQT